MKKVLLALAAVALAPAVAFAEEEAGVTDGQFWANNVWMMVSAGLVFIMHLGFASVE